MIAPIATLAPKVSRVTERHVRSTLAPLTKQAA